MGGDSQFLIKSINIVMVVLIIHVFYWLFIFLNILLLYKLSLNQDFAKLWQEYFASNFWGLTFDMEI